MSGPMKHYLKNTKGFTLIEALIAMLVLTVGILGISTMQITSTKGNTTANKLTIASTAAGNSYELLLNLPYDDPALDPDPAVNPHNQAELTGLVLPSDVTSVSWNVTEWTNTDGIDNDGDGLTDEADELNIKNIALNVNYTNRSAKTITINFLKSEML